MNVIDELNNAQNNLLIERHLEELREALELTYQIIEKQQTTIETLKKTQIKILEHLLKKVKP